MDVSLRLKEELDIIAEAWVYLNLEREFVKL